MEPKLIVSTPAVQIARRKVQVVLFILPPPC
jgi:hypothetical protein